MANYVHNYLFCNKEAKEKLLSLDYEYIYEIARCYGETVIPITDSQFLVMFDTRGMDYKTDFIDKFINEFQDTRWYSIEENEIEEGFFYWDGEKVEFKKRELVYELPGREIRIRYADDEYRPVLVINISDTEIVVENYLRNEVDKFNFCGESAVAICEYIGSLFAGEVGEFIGYAVPIKNGVRRTIHIYWGRELFIEPFDEDEDWQKNVEDGEALFNEVVSFFESILDKEQIRKSITIKDSILEIL